MSRLEVRTVTLAFSGGIVVRAAGVVGGEGEALLRPKMQDSLSRGV